MCTNMFLNRYYTVGTRFSERFSSINTSKIYFNKKLIHSTSVNIAESPLNGVRVVDLTRIVAGPYCTMILSDLGAEIIKIERPGAGDESRKWGPPYVNNTLETCYHVSINRNKKSVCVDLKSAKGRELIYELVKKSDVFVENYVPGKMEELGLGYNHLRQLAPQLIYCSITGYGSDGPYRKRPGYDVIAASEGGMMHITGPPDGEPAKPGVAVADMATGLYAHGAILAALIKRGKTGRGQKIDCNLLSSQVAQLINVGSSYLNANMEAKRWGTAHSQIVPYQAFPTNDGYYTIGTGSDLQFQDLCTRLGQPELAKNEKYLTNSLRIKHRSELIPYLINILTTKTNKEWSKVFNGASFPCGPLNSIKQVFDDPHIKAIKLVETVRHPVLGDIRMVGPPVKYSEGGNVIRTPPPVLGEHTRDVLRDVLSYSDVMIDGLFEEKIVQ